MNSPVAIEPKHVYGIRSEVIGNIHFNINQEVIYPVEGVLAFHDYVTNKQRFLRLPSNTTPTVIALNSTKLLMAIVEVSFNEHRERQNSIVIYDLLTLKKLQTYQLQPNARHKNITCISFTCDSKAIAVLTEHPDEMLCMIFFDKLGTVIEGRAGNSNRRGIASYISCNPQNPYIVAVCGEGVLKLMIKSEKNFSFYGDFKTNFHATSIAWISAETFIVGTKQGMLILYTNAIKQKTYRGIDVESLVLTAGQPDYDNHLFQETSTTHNDNPIKSEAIVCMTAFSKGLAFAIFNRVYVFEKISNEQYERKTILDIPMDNYPEELYQITNMAINLKQDTIIVTPKHNQIYVGILIVPESLETKMLKFQTLGELMHIDEILDICMCSWRPIIVTSSKDKTVRVWNYHTGKVELVKRFPVEVTVIELYASGQYAAVGFIDKVKIMQIFMNDMNLIKMYNFPNSKDIKFSYFGHLMATAYDNNIAITSVFNLENLRTFKGHSGTVLTLAWARNDKSVISGGADGCLYQWDIETGARLQEFTQPGVEFHALCVPNDPECFFGATNTGIISEFRNSKVVREVRMPAHSPLQDIGLTRSDLVMFAATKGGHLYNVHMPLSDPAGGTLTKFSFFDSAITKLRFSYDGTLLITSSASGTLVIWQLRNIEGKVTSIDHDLLKSQEVLIPRQELEEKIERIRTLEKQLKKQAAEFYNKQSQNEENEQQQMADTHKGYCEALTELNSKTQEISERHSDELNQVTSQIDELNAEHKLTMEKLSAQYSDRMSMEYQKFAVLRESMLQIRDSYEKKLAKSEGCLRDTVEALELDFKKQLEERQELIRQLMKEMDDKKIEFSEFCRQVEIENDRKMIDCQIEYENKVKFERDETDKWKTQANVHQTKYDTVKKECENLLEDVEKLKDQHYKSKAVIAELMNDISDLHKDITERENVINLKEKRIDEMLLKNEELEKYKQVLNHKINELRAQIEPREMTIVEKRKQITEMEQELSGLQKNNIQLMLQLKELKDKCVSVNVELNQERSRAKSAQLCVTQLSTEIYQLSLKLSHIDEMKEGIRNLFLKYSDDDALKKFTISDAPKQADLQKQRTNIEKIMLSCKRKAEKKAFQGTSKKHQIENKILKEELDKLRKKRDKMKTEKQNLKVLVDIFKIHSSQKEQQDFRQQPEEGLMKTENIRKYFENRIIQLNSEVKNLHEQNAKCRKNIGMKRMMLNKTDL